ncbi:MAG: KH domain-containing protein [Deltaproteobacteria bacterium]|nr:KH domain-containing protein [Deltaproteobacteria bacterium]
MPSTQLTELVAVMARALVDKPDTVEVEEFASDGGSSVVELRVARDDIGKVIGKSGKTAEAMRVVLSAASAKVGRRVHLDILD